MSKIDFAQHTLIRFGYDPKTKQAFETRCVLIRPAGRVKSQTMRVATQSEHYSHVSKGGCGWKTLSEGLGNPGEYAHVVIPLEDLW